MILIGLRWRHIGLDWLLKMETNTHKMWRGIGWVQGLNLLFYISCTLVDSSMASELIFKKCIWHSITTSLNPENPGLTIYMAAMIRSCKY